jgi:hypothetical protein
VCGVGTVMDERRLRNLTNPSLPANPNSRDLFTVVLDVLNLEPRLSRATRPS